MAEGRELTLYSSLCTLVYTYMCAYSCQKITSSWALICQVRKGLLAGLEHFCLKLRTIRGASKSTAEKFTLKVRVDFCQCSNLSHHPCTWVMGHATHLVELHLSFSPLKLVY